MAAQAAVEKRIMELHKQLEDWRLAGDGAYGVVSAVQGIVVELDQMVQWQPNEARNAMTKLHILSLAVEFLKSRHVEIVMAVVRFFATILHAVDWSAHIRTMGVVQTALPQLHARLQRYITAGRPNNVTEDAAANLLLMLNLLLAIVRQHADQAREHVILLDLLRTVMAFTQVQFPHRQVSAVALNFFRAILDQQHPAYAEYIIRSGVIHELPHRAGPLPPAFHIMLALHGRNQQNAFILYLSNALHQFQPQEEFEALAALYMGLGSSRLLMETFTRLAPAPLAADEEM